MTTEDIIRILPMDFSDPGFCNFMGYNRDFHIGAQDCKEGNPPKSLKSRDYYSGYSAQYQKEQILGAYHE